MLFSLALGLAVGLYVAAIAAAAVTARRLRRAPLPPEPAVLPRIAIVVAARDEETALPRCLAALLAQDYPADRLDIFVADDGSTDGTAAVVTRWRARSRRAVGAAVPAGVDDDPEPSRARVQYVRVGEPVGALRGKALALHTAISASDHELVLVTDADCAPPPTWARALASHLACPGVGLACGLTVVEAGRGSPPLAQAQALDCAFLLTLCSTGAGSGRPLSGMGNNMGFRRAAYDAVGGYSALPFSVTEDFALFQAVARRTPWGVRFPLDARLNVRTQPLSRAADVYRQRRRWARGAMGAPALVRTFYVVAHLAHLLPLVALWAAPPFALAALALKAAADGALVAPSLPRDRREALGAFVAFEALLFGYLTTLPVALLVAPRLRWKGRAL